MTVPERSADFTWLHHPYDGGADVLLPTTRERNQLRRRHGDWISGHPAGWELARVDLHIARETHASPR